MSLWDRIFPNNDLPAARALVQQKKMKDDIAAMKVKLEKLRIEERAITDANPKLIKRIEISDMLEEIKRKETELEISQLESGSLAPPSPTPSATLLTDSDFLPIAGGADDAELQAALAASLAEPGHPPARPTPGAHHPPMFVPKNHHPPAPARTPERTNRNNPSTREMQELEEARLRSLLQNSSPTYSPNPLNDSLEQDLRRIRELEERGAVSSPAAPSRPPAPRKDSLSPEEIEQLAALAENDEDRRIRESQDRAYQASLAADRAREREEQQKREEAARKEREEQQKKEAEERRAAEAEAAAKAKLLQRKNRIQALQSMINEVPQNQKEGVTLLKIRLPTGETATKRFLTDAKLDTVMDFVELKQLEADEAANAPIRESQRATWQLVLSFPQRVFTAEDLQKSLAELKLINTALFVKET